MEMAMQKNKNLLLSNMLDSRMYAVYYVLSSDTETKSTTTTEQPKVNAQVDSSKLKSMLAGLKKVE